MIDRGAPPQDAATYDGAYRNFFDSLSGKRKGRRVGAPRFRSGKDNRQAFRLTRNGFTVTSRCVRLAKIGDVELVWSRQLPSEPSSVSVIREADGRYFVSFVVERDEQPLPQAPTVAGIDLGLTDLAVIARSDGTREKVPAPRHLRAAEKRVARAQKALARKEKGSHNRAKARIRVAVVHRKVRETRLDHHHKLARRLIHENQVVAVEDLAVAVWSAPGWRSRCMRPGGPPWCGYFRRRLPCMGGRW
ncbi:RNA-guided endonuclease InsQ/TnpB family protein [Rhodococcus marinonascens]|uniref:RNA-guided endonuclease InsQ/TnpB family protein n=1 Tax=Rhodococcus marinonascens TaxID=38311 RepID=UPI000B11AA1D|nr:RNA-guided endonuclease TnpB family protein [Rhodococcus marinonascens]